MGHANLLHNAHTAEGHHLTKGLNGHGVNAVTLSATATKKPMCSCSYCHYTASRLRKSYKMMTTIFQNVWMCQTLLPLWSTVLYQLKATSNT